MARWLLLVIIVVITGCSSSVKADVERQSASQADFELELRGAALTPPRQLDDFVLPSTTGEFRLSSDQGKVVLLFFGYLSCPDVCPGTAANLRWVYENLGEQSNQVQVVFVTVDPERDTLERLDIYLSLFHEDIIGVRAEGETLQRLMDQFGARAEKQVLDDSAMTYLMDHTASVFLIDQDHTLIEQFMFGTPPDDILRDVQLILKGSANE